PCAVVSHAGSYQKPANGFRCQGLVPWSFTLYVRCQVESVEPAWLRSSKPTSATTGQARWHGQERRPAGVAASVKHHGTSPWHARGREGGWSSSQRQSPRVEPVA